MRVLVTGATGFAGPAVVARLALRGHEVIAAARTRHAASIAAAATATLPDLAYPFDAAALMQGVDAVVHLAGIAHASAVIPEATYIAVNCLAAERLAFAAREAGVRRFIFVSSVRAQSGPAAPGVLCGHAQADRCLRPLETCRRARDCGGACRFRDGSCRVASCAHVWR